MSRNLSPLMRPTSLQPSLRGPRDAAPPRVHSIATPEERAADTPAAAPTPKPNLLESTMSTQQRVIDALTKKSPQTRAQLAAMTGMATAQLSNALFNARNTKKITATGKGADREYSVAGSAPKAKATKPAKVAKRTTKKRTPKAERESFADGVKRIEREQASRETGTDLRTGIGQHEVELGDIDRIVGKNLDEAMREVLRGAYRPPYNTEATAIPCRAIATANGGAIVLRGNQLTAELNAEELNVLHQLRG